MTSEHLNLKLGDEYYPDYVDWCKKYEEKLVLKGLKIRNEEIKAFEELMTGIENNPELNKIRNLAKDKKKIVQKAPKGDIQKKAVYYRTVAAGDWRDVKHRMHLEYMEKENETLKRRKEVAKNHEEQLGKIPQLLLEVEQENLLTSQDSLSRFFKKLTDFEKDPKNPKKYMKTRTPLSWLKTSIGRKCTVSTNVLFRPDYSWDGYAELYQHTETEHNQRNVMFMFVAHHLWTLLDKAEELRLSKEVGAEEELIQVHTEFKRFFNKVGPLLFPDTGFGDYALNISSSLIIKFYSSPKPPRQFVFYEIEEATLNSIDLDTAVIWC